MPDENVYKEHPIQPGKCPPKGCPEPDRIECIVVDKVYDSCFQVDQRSREFKITIGNYMDFETGPFAPDDIIPCTLTPNAEITCTPISRTPTTEEGFFTLTLSITVPMTLTNPNNKNETVDKEFRYTKTVTLCCPEGVAPDCSESTLQHCVCVVNEVNEGEIIVTCDIQVCLVIKCILSVQLLVPSYGFCVPAPCVTIPGVCPPLPPSQCF